LFSIIEAAASSLPWIDRVEAAAVAPLADRIGPKNAAAHPAQVAMSRLRRLKVLLTSSA